jgi:peroxiredoxin
VTRKLWLRWCILAVAVAVIGRSPVSEAHPELGSSYEPEALKLLDEVVQRYRDLPAYVDHGKLFLACEINGKKSSESTSMPFAFARPNRMMIRCASLRFFNDGREITSVLDSSRTYMVDAPPRDGRMIPESIVRYPGGATILGGVSGLPAYVVLNLLTSSDARKAILEETDGLRLETVASESARSRQSLFIDQHQGPDIRLFVDRKTKLVTEILVLLDPSQLFERPPTGVVVSNLSFGWVSGAISTEPPDPSTFTFKPPQGYKKVTTWESTPDNSGPQEVITGKPAPDLTLTILDGPKGAKPLRLADLKGKVVVMVFWASWSPPCFDQLNWIRSGILDKFRDRGVVLVAVNIDDEPVEINEARAKVVHVLTQRGMLLDQAPYSYVAIDPVNAVGQSLGVKAIPTTLILDRDGIVRYAVSGFKKGESEPRPERLEKLIESSAAR